MSWVHSTTAVAHASRLERALVTTDTADSDSANDKLSDHLWLLRLDNGA